MKNRLKVSKILWILGTGLILRLISLNQSFWLDEAVQTWASSSFTLRDLIIKYMPGDFNPPLYHILLHFWIKLFGVSEIGVRSLSVLLGLGCVWMVWKIGKRLENGTNRTNKSNGLYLGVIAALFLATSPLHIYYSQEARMYILACFLVLLTVWRFLILRERTNWRNSFLLGLSFVLMGFSHFLTLLTIPVFLVFSFRGFRTVWNVRERKKIVLPFLLLLVGYLIYSPLLLKQLQTGLEWTKEFPVWGQTVGSFSLKAAMLLPVKFVIGRISIDNKLIYGIASLVMAGIYWGTIIKLKVKSEKLKVEFKIKNFQDLILSLLFVPPMLGFLISLKVPVFSYFRFLFCLPFFYLAIGMGVREIRDVRSAGWRIRGILCLLVLINLVCSGIYLFDPKFHREDWRGAVEWINKIDKTNGSDKSNKTVLILSQISKPFEYYDKGKNQVYFVSGGGNLGELGMLEGVEKEEEVFLVSYSLPIFDPGDKIRQELRSMKYELKSGESFGQVGVERWGK